MDNYNGILAFYCLELMYILKLRISPSYNRLVWETPFCFTVLDLFLQINDLTPPPVLVLVFKKFSILGSYEVLNTNVFFAYLFATFEILKLVPRILIPSCFKRLLLGVSKVQNTYILPPG